MPRYELQYVKEGPARYISHLDLLRTLERAARRANLPLAFTQGFNPHPRISFAAPLAVGVTGEAELAEIELYRDLAGEQLAGSLNASLPEGLSIKSVRQRPGDAPALMSAVQRATYQCEAELGRRPARDELDQAVKSFLARSEITVMRKSKTGGMKKYDIRPGIFKMCANVAGGIIIIEAELKTGSSGNIRVEELTGAFLEHFPLDLKTGGFSLCRTGIHTGSWKTEA